MLPLLDNFIYDWNAYAGQLCSSWSLSQGVPWLSLPWPILECMILFPEFGIGPAFCDSETPVKMWLELLTKHHAGQYEIYQQRLWLEMACTFPQYHKTCPSQAAMHPLYESLHNICYWHMLDWISITMAKLSLHTIVESHPINSIISFVSKIVTLAKELSCSATFPFVGFNYAQSNACSVLACNCFPHKSFVYQLTSDEDM